MKDLSSASMNWPVKGRFVGSPYANQDSRSVWAAMTEQTKDDNEPGEELVAGEGSESPSERDQ